MTYNREDGIFMEVRIDQAFKKAKEAALKAVNKSIAARKAKGYPVEYDAKDKAKIEALSAWPTDSIQLRDVDVAYKAKLLKHQLEFFYPEHKFSVKIERFSMGSAINVVWHGKKIDSLQKALDKIGNKYSDRGQTDSSTDYFDYDNYVHIQEDPDQRFGKGSPDATLAKKGVSILEVK